MRFCSKMNNSEKLYFLKSDLAKFMRQIYTSTKVNLSENQDSHSGDNFGFH